MNPSVYQGTGLGWSGSLCKLVNYSQPIAEERMRHHLATWITEDDIRAIRAYGFNSIRLPIGYWNILPSSSSSPSSSSPHYAPSHVKESLKYLDWIFSVTKRHNLTVLLDLHGAPGSQNGIDHSGCSQPSHWDTPLNIQLTYQTLDLLMTRYGSQPNLLGVELLNEPNHDLSHETLREFYAHCYQLIRAHGNHGLLIVYNELYSEYYSLWRGEFEEPEYHNLLMDWHLYHWQDYYRENSVAEHVRAAHDWRDLIDEYSTPDDNPILIGEWSMSTGPTLQVGQAFVSETIESFAKSWAVGWYVWNWKIDQSVLVSTRTGEAAGGGGGEGEVGEEKKNAEYDAWDVQLQSTLKDGLVIPFVE
jgi:glucan 1,3-beta-glucosidase